MVQTACCCDSSVNAEYLECFVITSHMDPTHEQKNSGPTNNYEQLIVMPNDGANSNDRNSILLLEFYA